MAWTERKWPRLVLRYLKRHRLIITVSVVSLLVGFGAGLVLRGPISGGLDWCRDIDYGNFPQWVAIAVGIIFGTITARGVWVASASYRHSRESYNEDVRLREYAQARQVHAEVVKSWQFVEGEAQPTRRAFLLSRSVETHIEKPGDGVESYIWFHGPNKKSTQDDYYLAIMSDGSGLGTAYQVRIVNNSEEMISRVNISIRSGDTLSFTGVPSSTPKAIVGPRSTLEYVVIIHEPSTSDHDLSVSFCDSSGVVWERAEDGPVVRMN